jgi:hypothetical protein
MDNVTSTKINVPFPQASSLHLKLDVGACRLRVAPSDAPEWVTGSYDDPSGILPARIELEGGSLRLTQELRTTDWRSEYKGPAPSFDLRLGKGQPYRVSIETGANESSFDLGGLPVTRLMVRHGAGKSDFNFSAPNPGAMSLLEVESGASGLEMRNLVNANFAELSLQGGAGTFRLDFGGAFQRKALARIRSGMASVEISIPATTAAKVTTDTMMGSLHVGDGFIKKEGALWTPAGLDEKAPRLEIRAGVSLGSITIKMI